MPQWAGSCWYYLRFIDPANSQRMLDAEAEKYWMPVDLYVGGAEHAVLHLLYARFWHKVGSFLAACVVHQLRLCVCMVIVCITCMCSSLGIAVMTVWWQCVRHAVSSVCVIILLRPGLHDMAILTDTERTLYKLQLFAWSHEWTAYSVSCNALPLAMFDTDGQCLASNQLLLFILYFFTFIIIMY